MKSKSKGDLGASLACDLVYLVTALAVTISNASVAADTSPVPILMVDSGPSPVDRSIDGKPVKALHSLSVDPSSGAFATSVTVAETTSPYRHVQLLWGTSRQWVTIDGSDQLSVPAILAIEGAENTSIGEAEGHYYHGGFGNVAVAGNAPGSDLCQWYYCAGIVKWPASYLPQRPGVLSSLWQAVGGDADDNGRPDSVPVIVEGMLAAIAGDPAPEPLFWRYVQRPRATRDNAISWVGGVTTTRGGRTVREGLFLRDPAGTIWPVVFLPTAGGPQWNQLNPILDYAVDSTGTHALVMARLASSSIFGSPAVLISSRQGSGYTAEILNVSGAGGQTVFKSGQFLHCDGAKPGELWQTFTAVALNDLSGPAPTMAIAGQTKFAGAQTRNIVVAVTRSGSSDYVARIVASTGSVVDNVVLDGVPRALAVNRSGDLAQHWVLAKVAGSTLVVNASVIARAFLDARQIAYGTPVDIDGDGAPNEDYYVSRIDGRDRFGLTDRYSRSGIPAVSTYFIGSTLGYNGMGHVDTLFHVQTPVTGSVACFADFNASGVVTVQDLFDFLAAWFAKCGDYSAAPSLAAPCYGRSADIDFSSRVTVQDLLTFLSRWFTGCQ